MKTAPLARVSIAVGVLAALLVSLFNVSPLTAAAGQVGNGRIVMVDDETDGGIYTVNHDGSSKTLILPLPSSIAGYYNPQWSPDGNKIVFASDKDDPGDTQDIYVINKDGTGLTRLTSTLSSDEYDPFW